MKLELRPGENITIRLGDRGVTTIQWIPDSEDCLVSVQYTPSTELKVSDHKEPAFGLPSILATLKERFK